MKVRRFAMTLTVMATLIGAMAPTVSASGSFNQATLEAAGWGCAAAVGLPDGHCINPGTVANFGKIVANGGTFELLVFAADGSFLTAESATFRDATNRPCRHDDEATNGTYWQFVPGLWVCHHRSE
ncbi:MAG: hypothetical protein ABIV26_06185 [Candidatus Limnocylindrales bacterium]